MSSYPKSVNLECISTWLWDLHMASQRSPKNHQESCPAERLTAVPQNHHTVSSLSASHPEGSGLSTWLFQPGKRTSCHVHLVCVCVCVWTPLLHLWMRPSQPVPCQKAWDTMLGWGNRSVPQCSNTMEINTIHSFYRPVYFPHFLWEKQ